MCLVSFIPQSRLFPKTKTFHQLSIGWWSSTFVDFNDRHLFPICCAAYRNASVIPGLNIFLSILCFGILQEIFPNCSMLRNLLGSRYQNAESEFPQLRFLFCLFFSVTRNQVKEQQVESNQSQAAALITSSFVCTVKS